MAASASVALRSSCLRAICRISTSSAARNVSVSSVLPSLRSSFVPRRTSISPTHSLRLLRRELSSLRPVHSAIASACLVSELPAEASASVEGRFVNYLSPI
ncbi:uncharacterized protein LOC111020511 [Momordica charantia]|uniref:Uncharacterized protein LOC111020511 n=1 Tax=Momordica charantia TaxID=3673 RepID=A0A6J1DG34_MOMCH|nr:uncharacterized protein LOC111020511 [Momordica charantia]